MLGLKVNNFFKKAFNDFIDFIFPKKCLSCLTDLENSDSKFCNTCEYFIEEIRYNLCNKCGYPLDIESVQCGMCSRLNFCFDMARSFCVYNEITKKMILDLKYSDNFSSVPFFIEAIRDLITFNNIEFDIISCVPMTKKRLMKRMYNQSAVLGMYLKDKIPAEKFSNVKFIPDLLIKTRESSVQTGSKAIDRITKKHYISLNPKYKKELSGKKILILDDVMTTGATLHACADALKKIDTSAKVYCFTFARSVLF